jgi:hypothetical protein
MKTVTNIIVYFILSISIAAYVYLFIYIKQKESFINSIREQNIENDGKMSFDYLSDKKYTKNLLNRFYANDDLFIQNNRIINHPFQKKYNNGYGYSSVLKNMRQNSEYSPFKSYSDYIYITYGVRL